MGEYMPMPAPKEDVVTGMGGIISKTADYKNYKNALGYSFLFFATEMVRNGDIRLLEVDGVMPDKSTIRDRTYPLAAEFYAVTAGSGNPNAAGSSNGFSPRRDRSWWRRLDIHRWVIHNGSGSTLDGIRFARENQISAQIVAE